ncbi:hypothetical protein HDU98_012046 [Podochytrium sp. JEL0797]|nr:hypothetical protein HDU98_012046 [Podochytrium sp. JEL0797]
MEPESLTPSPFLVVNSSAVPAMSDPQPTAAPVERKPNQLKALSRKTLSYQKRQMFQNVCCICMCPLMMVLISAILGTVINTLIAKSNPVQDILFCGNNNSLSANSWPIFNTTDPRIYGANSTVSNNKSVNFMQYINLNNIDGPPGAQLLNINQPCVLWFGDEYPTNSEIYEKNANLTGSAKVDSTYIPPPDGGWIAQLMKLATDPKSFDFIAFQSFTRFQQSGWNIVGAKPGLESALGVLPDAGPLSPAQGLALANNASAILNPVFDPATGILGSVSQRLYVNFTASTDPSQPPYALQNFRLVPYFTANSTVQTPDDIDNVLSDKLNIIISGLASLDKSVLLKPKSQQTVAELQAFYLSANKVTSQMPYGGIFLESFDAEKGTVQFVLSIGTDKRVSSSSTFPSRGFRMLETVAQLGQAVFRATGGSASISAGAVTQSVRAFPQVKSTAITFPFGGLIGRILYPFGVSFLLPIFVIMLVKEKEDRM